MKTLPGTTCSQVTSNGNEVVLNWITVNDHGIRICKSVFQENDMFPNSFSGPQQAISIEKDYLGPTTPLAI